MAKATINSGNCGFKTEVEATMNDAMCNLKINSECTAIQRLAENLDPVNPYQEISFRRNTPTIHEKGAQFCSHASCPVPVGIIKAVEVEAGLALPANVTIELTDKK